MPLVDEILSKQGHQTKGGGCSVARFLTDQESWPVPEGKERRYTRAEWDAVLADSRLEHRAAWDTMREYGFDRQRGAVSHHRNGVCACPKT